MDNMVLSAQLPKLNSIKMEATHQMDDINVAQEHFVADYDGNVAVSFNLTHKLPNTNSVENDFMDININEKPQSESESDELYDECYSCFMCNVSYNTQVDLDAHLNTHIDDDTFHHSNINSISEPLPQSSIRPSKYFRCNECLKVYKSQLSYHEHMLIHTGEKPHHCRAENEKSERETALETSRQDIQNMLQKRKQLQLNNYSTELTEEHKKLIEALVLEKKSTGHVNIPNLTGPLFWKSALINAGLREEDVNPMQFLNRLKITECMSCGKCFAKSPLHEQCTEKNITSSKPPCSSCFMIKNESALNKHKLQFHKETSPYVCKECLFESNTWFDYVQHMKMHLKYAGKCSECVYSLLNKPDSVMFLCDVCEMSFDSDELLNAHVQTHLENGQSKD